jgi:hypothetical protein
MRKLRVRPSPPIISMTDRTIIRQRWLRQAIFGFMRPAWIDSLARFAGPRIPHYLRAIPDLTDDSLHEIENENEKKLAVPGFSQTDWYSCGATAGWAVVKTFHPQSSFRDFYRDCNPLPLEGTTEGKLVKALRRHGIGISIRSDLTFATVRGAVESGFPVIAQIGREYHWIVVYGIGWRPNRVFICNQPRMGFSRQELLWADFRQEWNPRGRGLICWGKPLRRAH